MQRHYALLTFIKAIIGSLLNTDLNLKGNLEDLNSLKPPLLLSFLEDDYWMYEILNAVLDLFNEKTEELFEGQLGYAINYKGLTFRNSVFSVFKKETLQNLFIAKKLTQRGEGEDRYEDFYNQPLDQELADSVG
jgi:hypothetical protein